MPSVHQQMNERTRSAIREAFIGLIEETGFDRVSVRQIGERAGIHRGTFYLHYLDKYDLMEQLQHELLEGFRQVLVVPIDFGEVYRHSTEKLAYPPFVAIFAYFDQNADLFRLLSGAKGEAGFSEKLKKTVIRSFRRKLENGRIFERFPAIPADYFTAYTASLLLGVVEAWLERRQPESAEELAVIYNEMMAMQRFLP